MNKRWMSADSIYSIPVMCIAVFFIAVFALHTTPIEDGDFFWHLRSGQWIWEHRALPSADPFSFTAKDVNPFRPESTNRIPYLLKQYWLGQLTLYGIWEAAGSAGIVLLRAFTYAGILAFLFAWMARLAGSSRRIMPLLFVFLAGNHLVEHPSERPQLFTFLFMPILLFLLEKTRKKENVFSGRAFLFLPLLMLVWANTHGGFLLGVGLILIGLLAHLADAALKRCNFNKGLVALLASSAMVSIINPNGFSTLKEYFGTASFYTETILENMSPIKAALQDHKIFTFYWIFFLIALITVILRAKKMELFHLAIIVSVGVFSLTSIRYMPFFLMTSPLLIGYIAERRPGIWKWAAVAAALTVWIAATDWSTRFRFEADRSFPKGAVNHMRRTPPPPQIFNYYDWGGYLMYFLPDYKVFIDGRGLVEEMTIVFEKCLYTGEWKTIFRSYGINTVVMPSTGSYFPLVANLIADPEWQVTYRDDTAAIFVRKAASQRN